MLYRHHTKRWARSFPVTIGCAIILAGLLITPSSTLSEYLKNYYSNVPSWISVLAPIYILFAYQASMLIYKQFKTKKQYTHDGKISFRAFLEMLNDSIFFGSDQIAILCLSIALFVIAVPESVTPEYHKIHIFENFVGIFVIPFISLINYYCKVLREESTPNFIINHFN